MMSEKQQSITFMFQNNTYILKGAQQFAVPPILDIKFYYMQKAIKFRCVSMINKKIVFLMQI